MMDRLPVVHPSGLIDALIYECALAVGRLPHPREVCETRRPLSVLLLEESDEDAKAEQDILDAGAVKAKTRRVETREAFIAALSVPTDVIVARYDAALAGLDALAIVHERGLDLPFILVSDPIGGEQAVEAMQSGATDIVFRDRLSRLAAAVSRSVEERHEHIAADRAAQVEALGRLAATMAHDFNNVLMAVLQVGEVIRRFYPDDARLMQVADRLFVATTRGQHITSEVLRSSQPVHPSIASFDAAHWLERIAPEMRPIAAGANVRLNLAVPRRALRARGDPEQLQQALLNLVTNACEAMAAGGDLKIVLSEEEGRVLLCVSDTGTGMPPKTLAHIFEPLFTTKRHRAGLGLAVVYKIVAANGGTIDVESQPGAGTTFMISLPKG